MEWAKDQNSEITKDVIKDDIDLTDYKDTINKQLYTLLATKTTEEPRLIVQNTDAGMGLEVWRKLNKRYDLKAKGMSSAGMKSIMKYASDRTKDLKSLNHKVEKLEDMMRRYEITTKNKIVDDMKISLITSMCPPNLEDHIELNGTNLNSYAKVRHEVMNYIEAKTAGSTAMDVSLIDETAKNEEAVDEADWCNDIDALGYYNYNNYGYYASPGKIKGKGGTWYTQKGKGKGESKGDHKGDKGKGKGKGKPMECYNCGRLGHRAADCWRKGGGKAAKCMSNFEEQWNTDPSTPIDLGDLDLACLAECNESKNTGEIPWTNAVGDHARADAEGDLVRIDRAAVPMAKPKTGITLSNKYSELMENNDEDCSNENHESIKDEVLIDGTI